MPREAAIIPRRTAVAALVLVLAGCGGGGAAVTSPADKGPVFAALRIDPPSASIPVGGTVQLSGVPADGSGNRMDGLPAPVFTSGDSTRAAVTASGMVTGKAAGDVTVTAKLTAAGVTRTATAAITITAPASPQNPQNPQNPGSPAPRTATVAGLDRTFSPSVVTIAAGGTVTWQMVEDDHDVTWDGPTPPGGNIPKTERGQSVSRTFPTPGTYTYRCARHADKGMTGTVVVVGSQPPADPPSAPKTVTVTTSGASFTPALVTIAAGGSVQWQISGATHNVTFQGTAPPGGSIPDTDAGGTATRTFPTAGSYPYVCTRHSGMSGRVVVQ